MARAVAVRAQRVERPGDRLLVALLPREQERLLEEPVREGVVALVARQQAGPAQRLAPMHRLAALDRDGRLEPDAPLGVVAARPPEVGERSGEPHGERAILAIDRPVERRTQIVVTL